jgi:hypothetical protein
MEPRAALGLPDDPIRRRVTAALKVGRDSVQISDDDPRVYRCGRVFVLLMRMAVPLLRGHRCGLAVMERRGHRCSWIRRARTA